MAQPCFFISTCKIFRASSYILLNNVICFYQISLLYFNLWSLNFFLSFELLNFTEKKKPYCLLHWSDYNPFSYLKNTLHQSKSILEWHICITRNLGFLISSGLYIKILVLTQLCVVPSGLALSDSYQTPGCIPYLVFRAGTLLLCVLLQKKPNARTGRHFVV